MSIPAKGPGPARSVIIPHFRVKAGRYQPLPDLRAIRPERVRDDCFVTIDQTTDRLYAVSDLLYKLADSRGHRCSPWHKDVEDGTARRNHGANRTCDLSIVRQLFLLIGGTIIYSLIADRDLCCICNGNWTKLPVKIKNPII